MTGGRSPRSLSGTGSTSLQGSRDWEQDSEDRHAAMMSAWGQMETGRGGSTGESQTTHWLLPSYLPQGSRLRVPRSSRAQAKVS